MERMVEADKYRFLEQEKENLRKGFQYHVLCLLNRETLELKLKHFNFRYRGYTLFFTENFVLLINVVRKH